MKAALDSNVLIYAFDDSHDAERKERRRRANILLEQLLDQNAIVIVPTVALAEFLVPYRPAEHGQVIATLKDSFIFPPFDVHAAAIAAEVWSKHQSFAEEDKIKKPFLKADAMIVATAKAVGAEVIYSNDPGLRRLADAVHLSSRGLPTHAENLFLDQRSREERSD
ncbi:MAG TPA: PIN domain-containing protein [Tepidisphaeraceae bacterium]|jgi:predicted nucleic acid-binding protein